MWILKFKSKEEFNIYNKRCVRFNIRIHFYSQKFYAEKTNIYFINYGIVFGDEKNKIAFFKNLRKDKKLTNLEVTNDFFISEYKEKKTEERIDALKTVYNQRIIFLKPTLLDEEGFEEWELASFDRKDLEDIIKQSQKLQKMIGGNFQLLSFKQQTIKHLMVRSIMPKLSTQQKKAIELAIENNYYGYPRKTTLKKLANLMNISDSTYQFHLSKAEEKILPFFYKKLSDKSDKKY
jgi:predicted DNA binding protein